MVERRHGSRDTARAATTDDVKDLRREARDLKEVVAEQMLELRLLKKHDRQWGRARMRYPASEKLEFIRLAEENHLSARLTLAKPGNPRTTFYRPLSGIFDVLPVDGI